MGIRELNEIRDDDRLQHLRLLKVLRAEIRAVDGEVYSLCVEAVVLPKDEEGTPKSDKAKKVPKDAKKSTFSMVARQRSTLLSCPTETISH